MFSYPRLGTETRPSVDSMCNAADEPCPIYDSRVGYTNGTLQNAQNMECLVRCLLINAPPNYNSCNSITGTNDDGTSSSSGLVDLTRALIPFHLW